MTLYVAHRCENPSGHGCSTVAAFAVGATGDVRMLCRHLTERRADGTAWATLDSVYWPIGLKAWADRNGHDLQPATEAHCEAFDAAYPPARVPVTAKEACAAREAKSMSAWRKEAR